MVTVEMFFYQMNIKLCRLWQRQKGFANGNGFKHSSNATYPESRIARKISPVLCYLNWNSLNLHILNHLLLLVHTFNVNVFQQCVIIPMCPKWPHEEWISVQIQYLWLGYLFAKYSSILFNSNSLLCIWTKISRLLKRQRGNELNIFTWTFITKIFNLFATLSKASSCHILQVISSLPITFSVTFHFTVYGEIHIFYY